VEGVVLGMVFRPGPVQGSGSRFWPGRPGQIFFLKKSKQRRFSKKNKNQLVAVGFLTGLQLGFWPDRRVNQVIPGFFLNPTRF
jgi:hypothetical protein